MCLKELLEDDFLRMIIDGVVSKRIIISRVNKERRKRFCRHFLTWTVRENLSRILFSDETKIMLGNNNKICLEEA